MTWYVVDSYGYDETAGSTGYERSHILYGPCDSREEADACLDGGYDEGTVIEMDAGEVLRGQQERDVRLLREIVETLRRVRLLDEADARLAGGAVSELAAMANRQENRALLAADERGARR